MSGVRGTPCCEPTEPAGETEYLELIMLVRKILSGSLLFACQILLPGKISTGLSGKLRQRKKQDFSKVEFFLYDEGLCVQCMHIGSYDDEPATVDAMHRFMEEQGYTLDITDQRMHHEIYLSDVRKVAPEKLKTVIRHPIKRA